MALDRRLYIGPRLRRVRRDLGLTQADMASDLDVSPSYVALLERNNRPTEDEVRAHLAPNLCRCGTHMRILRAVRRAAEMMGGGVRDVAEQKP